MPEIRNDAKRIKDYINDRKDVFIYFNNDFHGYAPTNARELMEMLKWKIRSGQKTDGVKSSLL